ncbi:MAG: sodium:proton antiporter [Dethiobacteria bacterium]|nr:cation:proton antiporter subunit C [Bacillota bacterium]MDW7728759.1 cation:proton antiporter subunit C [Bacillota bacterium]
MNLELLFVNFPYFVAIILFSLGTLIVLTQTNLIKKVIGINILQSAIFLFFIILGDIQGGVPPIYDPNFPDALYVNPLPSTLMLTGIVVSFSVTAFALALIVKLYLFYGTICAPNFMKLK